MAPVFPKVEDPGLVPTLSCWLAARLALRAEMRLVRELGRYREMVRSQVRVEHRLDSGWGLGSESAEECLAAERRGCSVLQDSQAPVQQVACARTAYRRRRQRAGRRKSQN